MSNFFIDTQTGRVATRGQLRAVGLADADDAPAKPWFEIQGPSDASTMWYSVLKKRERGVFIGTLCIRHGSRLASLRKTGWEEVAVADIGPDE